MKRFFSAAWLVPMIVATTFGSIVGFCTVAAAAWIIDWFEPTWVRPFILWTALPAMAIGTYYQRVKTIPRLKKADLTGTACHGLALFGLIGGSILVTTNGFPAATPWILVLLGYLIGGLLHLRFKPVPWHPDPAL